MTPTTLHKIEDLEIEEHHPPNQSSAIQKNTNHPTSKKKIPTTHHSWNLNKAFLHQSYLSVYSATTTLYSQPNQPTKPTTWYCGERERERERERMASSGATLEDIPSVDIMTELLRRFKCDSKPDKRLILVGVCVHLIFLFLVVLN